MLLLNVILFLFLSTLFLPFECKLMYSLVVVSLYDMDSYEPWEQEWQDYDYHLQRNPHLGTSALYFL